ncbi:MAG: hypothetical protein LBH91_04460 [Prevotellaceae bacterium]|nr:hypothetical protein [Prevotellaceae bacterium]
MPSFAILILISIALVGFCVVALAISIIVKKNGKFPEREIGKNKRLRKLGLRCPRQEEMMRWRKKSSCNGCSGDE